MHPSGHDGWVEVISGVLFSGKSEELLRRVRHAAIARKRIQIFKSHVDYRYRGARHPTSHDGTRIEAQPVGNAREIQRFVNPEIDVAGIDKAHFLDEEILSVMQWLADRHLSVINAGTDLDFPGEPFGAMGDLTASARRWPSCLEHSDQGVD